MMSSSMSSFKVSSMMSSLAGRLISGRVRLLARSRFQSRRSRSAVSRSPFGCRCSMSSSPRRSCCMSGHAACVGCSGRGRKCESLSLHLDFQVPLQGFSILFMWPCCMSSMLGPWSSSYS